MSKNLVIVESPAKAKTIKKYLGKDFQVESSFGHIRDLPKKNLSIDIENNFAPKYEVSADKKKVVSSLKKAAAGAEVWLASDEDREGEAIAWHLCHALKLDPEKTKRIVFHEITKPAIDNAVKNPRTINKQLVDAQQARRILDRIVGYELSPVLWRKIRPGLSAGRVQSVAVRLIVEREREIQSYEPQSSFKVSAVFSTKDGTEFSAELKDKLDTEAEARGFLEDLISATFKVTDVQQKPSERNPSAPFTTSSLQQEAARRLGYSVKQTMTVAQKLYENGHITYMRTDSSTLSKTAIDGSASYIKKNFGDDYHKVRQYKTKSQGAQEAHEAIRPTDPTNTNAGENDSQQKLYQLVWQRTIASQMTAAKTDKTVVTIAPSSTEKAFTAKGEVLRFDGFMKVYGGTKEDVILPELKLNDSVVRQSVTASETFSKSPPRYSEASLVKKLEDLGIGRPSTYAPTISTIQDRGYIEKADLEGEERAQTVLELSNSAVTSKQEIQTYGADKSKLLPTSTALVTTDFLVKHFSSIVDYDFTANAEKSFDEIATGETNWVQVLKSFYGKFEPLVEKSASVTRQESTQMKLLGEDPKSKKPIFARFGKYGLMLQRGDGKEDVKPEFAPMPEGKTIDTVTLEDALEMYKLPRLVGQTEDGKDIMANIGRFGPYIKVDALHVSIKPQDPMTITLEEARKLYNEKLEIEKNKYIKEFSGGIQVIKGPYGPYVTNGKKNVRVPATTDPKSLTEAKAKELLEKAPNRKKRYRKRR